MFGVAAQQLGQRQEPGDSAGVVIGAGSRVAAIIVSADDDPPASLGSEGANHVLVLRAVDRVLLNGDRCAGCLEMLANVRDTLGKVVMVLIGTRCEIDRECLRRVRATIPG